jgi:predicted MPP superfamily phosphohydrolase
MFWVVFIVIYTLLTWGSLKSILRILNSKYKKSFGILYIVISCSIILSMIFLYVWPGDIRSSGNYKLYSFFNGTLFLDLLIKTPLTLLFLFSIFLRNEINKKIMSWLGILVSGLTGIILFYGMIIGKNEVVVNNLELHFKNLPKSFNNYTIAQISDIHLGSFTSKSVMEKTRQKMGKLNPDLVLFTGDLVNNLSNELEGWSSIFSEINSQGMSFSILGNHDYGNYSNWNTESDKENNFNSITAAHNQFGFKLLRNENVKLYSGGDSIYLVGVENWGHPPFPQYANLQKGLSGISDDDFTIMMTHDPAHWESKIEGKKSIELTLSGHTHGLQFGVKPAGIPFSLSYFIRNNWGGLYKSNHSYLYVNTGLGTIGIPYRIDIPAEITLFTLKRIEVDGK